jgi:hypothetical protein
MCRAGAFPDARAGVEGFAAVVRGCFARVVSNRGAAAGGDAAFDGERCADVVAPAVESGSNLGVDFSVHAAPDSRRTATRAAWDRQCTTNGVIVSGTKVDELAESGECGREGSEAPGGERQPHEHEQHTCHELQRADPPPKRLHPRQQPVDTERAHEKR